MKEYELEQLATWLKKKHLPLKTEWLKICVEYLNQSLGSKLSSLGKLLNLVMQQFLSSKLSETLNPVMKIPTKAAKVFIVKRMIFEMTSYTNVSLSLYEQLSECTRHNDDLSWFHGGLKIDHDEDNREKEEDTTFNQVDKNNNNNNNNRPIFKKRGMLKLDLTDGMNKVKAIEVEEVFDEKLLVPGVKIMLTGRVKCRRGVLFLDKSNCSLLGGRIEAMKIDKIKQLSEALKIDLDAEKKRRQDSLEKAAASVSSRKKNSSLNQSSISPFLVKTNRKTGEVTNPPKAPSVHLESHSVNPDPVENWEDCSIEEIPIQTIPEPSKTLYSGTKQLPLPPTKRLSSLVIDKEEDRKPSLERPQRREERDKGAKDWSLHSISPLEKKLNKSVIHPEQKPKKKQLPGQLLGAELSQRPTLGTSSMIPEKRKEISEWVWDDRKGSKEEQVSAKRKLDDSVMVLPQFFIQPKKEKLDEYFDPKPHHYLKKKLINIHGPRKRIEDFRVKANSSGVQITGRFPIVKGAFTVNKSIEIPLKLLKELESVPVPETIVHENQEEPDERQEEEDLEYDDIEEIVPTTPYPRLGSTYFDVEEAYQVPLDEGNEQDDSIMECTMEQEGRMECERWGLQGKDAAEEQLNTYTVHKNNGVVMRNLLPPPLRKGQFLAGGDYLSQHAQPSYTTPSTQSWNFKDRSVKTERIENPADERLLMMRLPSQKMSSIQDIDEHIKNKQSANVQIYKTPFAKRLNSTDSSATATSKLMERMSDLQIVPFADALFNRKFWMMSKIVVVMPTICSQLHELKSDGVDWLLQISVTDTSAADVKCRVATVLLNRIFGFNVQQCKNLFNSNQLEQLRIKKAEAERKLLGFKRLDLLIWVEVSPEPNKLPLILDVKTISDALNIL